MNEIDSLELIIVEKLLGFIYSMKFTRLPTTNGEGNREWRVENGELHLPKILTAPSLPAAGSQTGN